VRPTSRATTRATYRHAGDLLDHHQRPGVTEHREDVRQAHAREVRERQEQHVEERVARLPAVPTNDPGQITEQATKTYAKPHATTVNAAPVA
jgi:hypothetical protein